MQSQNKAESKFGDPAESKLASRTPVEAALAGDFESLQTDTDIDMAISGVEELIKAEALHAQLESHKQHQEWFKKISEQELARVQEQVDSCIRGKERAEEAIKDAERRQSALKKMETTISQLRERKDCMRAPTFPGRSVRPASMRAEASPPHEQHLSYPSDLDLLFFIHFALPNNDRGLPFPDITSLCTQDISTTNTQPGRLETQEVTTKSKMTSRNYNQASSKCNSSNMVDDLYADMPPLVTADGVTVVEQDDTSTPRTTLDTTAGIDFPEGPKKYFINMRAFNALSRSAGTPDAKPETKRLNAKSLAELSTSNIKVDIEEVSELSEDEEVLTPAASEFDAASIADTNAKDISDDLILDSVCAIDGGITEKRRVARQDLLKNQSVKGFNSTGDKMKKHKAESGIQNCENDAPIKAMAHKYASGHAFMNKVHNKVEHLQTLLKEKAELQASHDRVNESMNKRMEAMEQKRKGLHKKLAEVRAKHDKVVEENAAWMAKNKEREEAVQGKKKKVDLSFLPSEQWLNE